MSKKQASKRKRGHVGRGHTRRHGNGHKVRLSDRGYRTLKRLRKRAGTRITSLSMTVEQALDDAYAVACKRGKWPL
jgi:hypothetical protein